MRREVGPALSRLRKLSGLNGTAAREADKLKAAGSSIARENSAREAQQHAQPSEITQRLAYRSGPLGDALSAAARNLTAGGKKLAAINEFVNAARGLDLQALTREGDGTGGSVAVDAQPEGEQPSFLDSRPEGPSLFADPEQPQRTMTQVQRSEMDTRQQQGMARRGGQQSVKDQEGGL